MHKASKTELLEEIGANNKSSGNTTACIEVQRIP
jgi:hypothetical protein